MSGATWNGGIESYWFEGLPSEHLRKSTSPLDEGIESYWFNGLPGESLFLSAAPPTTIIKDIIQEGIIVFSR